MIAVMIPQQSSFFDTTKTQNRNLQRNKQHQTTSDRVINSA